MNKKKTKKEETSNETRPNSKLCLMTSHDQVHVFNLKSIMKLI